MNFNRAIQTAAAAATVALGLFGAAATAHAHGAVSWSIGLGVPGISVGAASGGYPAYYAPAPVYVQPPAPVYVAPPVPIYVAPRPVYYAPPPVYYAPPRPAYYYGGGYSWRHDRGGNGRFERGHR